VLKGIERGAQLYVIDPRRTASTARGPTCGWPDRRHRHRAVQHVAHEILAAGLENRAFIARATEGFDAYRAHVLGVDPLERGEASPACPPTPSRAWRTPTPAPIAP
jgi:predicted molibdopterin-dependent oxidoreductase YjgC